MATKIKGPLTLGSEAADQDYNSQMRGLMEQLIQTPEERDRDELLAWSGGLRDPAGQGRLGDSITNANKEQSSYRMEDRRLRAQYIPLIMNALAAQQQNALAGGIGVDQLRGMPPEKVYQLTVATGKDLMPLWEMANGLKTAKPGDYRYGFNNGAPTLEGVFAQTDKPNPVINNGQVVGAANLPGAPEATSQFSGAQAYGSELGKRFGGLRTIMGPNGARREVPGYQLEGPPPSFGAVFGGQGGPSVGMPVPPPTGQPGGVPTGPAGAPPGTISPPQTPIPTGGTAATAGPVGPRIPAAQQAALDSDIPAILNGELATAQKRLAEAKTPEEQARAQQDIAAITREMQAKKIPVAGVAPATVIKTPVVSPLAVPQSPGGGYQIELSPAQVQQNKNTADLSTGFLKDYEGLKAKAANFANEEQQLLQAEQGLARLGKTGPWTTESKKQSAEILSALGFKADERYLTSYQQVEQAINTRVNAAIMADRGVATEGDAKRHKEATLNLKGTQDYNRYMLDVYKATLAREKQKWDFYQDAMMNRNKLPDGDLERIGIAWQQKVQQPLMEMPSMAKWKKRYGWTNER